MDGASLVGSLDRIEAALGKIEARAQEIGQAVSGPAAAVEGDLELRQLELRHRALRGSVQSALARIDALLVEHAE